MSACADDRMRPAADIPMLFHPFCRRPWSLTHRGNRMTTPAPQAFRKGVEQQKRPTASVIFSSVAGMRVRYIKKDDPGHAKLYSECEPKP